MEALFFIDEISLKIKIQNQKLKNEMIFECLKMPKSWGGKKLAKFLYVVSGNDSQKCRRMKCSGCPPAFRERKSPNLFLKSQKIN